jgi:hypothetical protein
LGTAFLFLVFAGAVVSADKDGGNCHEVFGELPGSFLLIIRIENHESDVTGLEKPLKEVKGNATESVSVGNHNFFDQSSACLVQNGTQPFPLEVDAGSNVGNDGMAGVLLAGVLDLMGEVSLLLLVAGGDPAVYETFPVNWGGGAQKSNNVFDGVEPPATGLLAGPDLATDRPTPEC